MPHRTTLSGIAYCVAFLALAESSASGAEADQINANQTALDLGTRIELANRLSKLRRGMSAKDVLQIVGAPDERRSVTSAATREPAELWCYGVGVQGAFPIRGSVELSRGAVTAVFGDKSPPAEVEEVAEEDVVRILTALDRIGDLTARSYNPQAMIASVNGLQALGKLRAFALVREYLRVAPYAPSTSTSTFKLQVLLSLLFDCEDVPRPQIIIGGTSPEAPTDDKLSVALPLYPVVVVDDIPLLLISGYRLLGNIPPIERYLDYYEVHGILRKKPLVPTTNLNGMMVKIEQAPWWAIYDENQVFRRATISMQLIRLTAALRPSNANCDWGNLTYSTIQSEWVKTSAHFNSRSILWDSHLSVYQWRDQRGSRN